MYRHVVVPLDGSDFSRAAVRYALALTSGESTLDLVSALDARMALTSVGYGGNLTGGASTLGTSTDVPAAAAEMLEASRKGREADLRKTAEAIQAKRPDLGVRWTLLDGEPSDAVAAHVAGSGGDLVVMSTHGRGGLERAWLGSVADRLVRHVTVPVLLVRPGEEPTGEGTLDDRPVIRRVLVPLDGSPLAECALELAARVAEDHGARVVLVRVTGAGVAVGSPYLPHAAEEQAARSEGKDREARRYLEGVAQRLGADGVEVVDIEVDTGSAVERILKHAADVDLIIMATHGRGGLRRWVLGSVSDKVLRGSDVPVLLVRPEDRPEEGHDLPH